MKSNPISDPFVQSILNWSDAQHPSALTQFSVPGSDNRERRQLAALGGLAKSVSDMAGMPVSNVPADVKNWWTNAPSPPNELVVEAYYRLKSDHDLFGSIYSAVVSTANRHKLSTVFTPPHIAAYMFDQGEKNGVVPETVIDPGAGVGAFTIDATKKWNVPTVAVDINVATLGFLAVRCHVQGLATEAYGSTDGGTKLGENVVHLVRKDFLSWLPNCLSGITSPALIVGNPPYTRHQMMDRNLKEVGQNAAGSLLPSRLAGMGAYFLAASLRHLRSRDAVCLILPSSWMYAKYGREIRKRLWCLKNRQVELTVFPHGIEVFPQASVDAMVLFVGPHGNSPRSFSVVATEVKGHKVTRSIRHTLVM